MDLLCVNTSHFSETVMDLLCVNTSHFSETVMTGTSGEGSPGGGASGGGTTGGSTYYTMTLLAKESGGTMLCSPSASGLHSGWPRARLSLGACGPLGQPGPWPALVQSLSTGGAKHSTFRLFCM